MKMTLFILNLVLCITLVSSSCMLRNSSYPNQTQDFTCQSIKTMDFSLKQAYANQPLHYLFLPKCEECLQIDNVCQTYFTLPDGAEYYKVYEVVVYQNGSSTTTTYVAKQDSTIGVSVFAAPCLTFTNYLFALVGTEVTVGYRCSNYGDSSSAPFVFGIGLTRSLNSSYWAPVADAIASVGLPVGKFHTLPNCLPSRCVTRELCQPEGSPLHGREGGTCQAPQEPEMCI